VGVAFFVGVAAFFSFGVADRARLAVARSLGAAVFAGAVFGVAGAFAFFGVAFFPSEPWITVTVDVPFADVSTVTVRVGAAAAAFAPPFFAGVVLAAAEEVVDFLRLRGAILNSWANV